MGVDLELELELEPRLPTAAPVDVVKAVHKWFIKPVHNSLVHKSFHKSFMTAVSVL